MTNVMITNTFTFISITYATQYKNQIMFTFVSVILKSKHVVIENSHLKVLPTNQGKFGTFVIKFSKYLVTLNLIFSLTLLYILAYFYRQLQYPGNLPGVFSCILLTLKAV